MALIHDTFGLKHSSVFSPRLVPESITIVAHDRKFKTTKKQMAIIQLTDKNDMQKLFNEINNFGHSDTAVKISREAADDIIEMISTFNTQRSKFIQQLLKG
tara:strand:- start:489 stop:791 length:303 start_codon:yes stop_codon:yes gene_type:complete